MIPTLEQSAAARQLGIERSARSAGREWAESAIDLVREYASLRSGWFNEFLAEDLREFASTRGLPEPANAKSWGRVMQSAKARAIIKACGYAPARSSNGSPKTLWQKA